VCLSQCFCVFTPYLKRNKKARERYNKGIYHIRDVMDLVLSNAEARNNMSEFSEAHRIYDTIEDALKDIDIPPRAVGDVDSFPLESTKYVKQMTGIMKARTLELEGEKDKALALYKSLPTEGTIRGAFAQKLVGEYMAAHKGDDISQRAENAMIKMSVGALGETAPHLDLPNVEFANYVKYRVQELSK